MEIEPKSKLLKDRRRERWGWGEEWDYSGLTFVLIMLLGCGTCGVNHYFREKTVQTCLQKHGAEKCRYFQ